MKKSIIAAGAASAVLAAMPVVGVFAETATGSTATVQDTIQLTVSSTCKMEADKDTTAASYGKTVNLGTHTVAYEFTEQTGTPMTITCNDNAGWSITATATSLSDVREAGTTGRTAQTIPFGAYPATADITAATASSVWSAKIALSGNNTSNATISSNWNNYAATTANDTTILTGNTDTAVSGLIVTPSYKAYGSKEQAAATYSGTITYTFVGSAS